MHAWRFGLKRRGGFRRLAGTRDRIARVADWAWPFVEQHLAAVLPGERLFRGIHRWAAGDVHRERCRALGLEGYRLRDARHHWAVRMVRAGMPLELVARQLGHRDVVMVARVYGRFVPNTVERTRWEQAASALDAEKWKEMGAVLGAVGRVNSPAPSVTAYPPSSRGGTRPEGRVPTNILQRSEGYSRGGLDAKREAQTTWSQQRETK